MNRRDMIKTTLSTVLALSTAGMANEKKSPEPKQTKRKSKPKHPRVVVVGGGWSGLSLAKSVKAFVPESEVTLVEKRYEFMSCPVSNPWLFDMVDLEFLTHSYIEAANNHGYDYVQATATGLDSKNNILKTTVGDIEYDYLVFALGIEYDYDKSTKGDKDLEHQLRMHYPGAFIPGSEHLTLKRKIENFKEGTFVLNVPSGNYRCLPAPYERACLLADHFKQNKMKAKVLLLDANNEITIKPQGFHSAFDKLYKGYLQYEPNSEILKFDLKNKTLITEFDEFTFDDFAFYPSVRAPKLLEELGLTIKTVYNRFEANLDHYTNKFVGYDNIYGCGDIRPMGFSKSGNTAYTEGENVARQIAADIQGKKHNWESPVTVCISLVSKKPHREISLVSQYKYDKKGATFFNGTFTDEAWKTNDLGKNRALFTWAKALYDNMFYI